MSENDGITPETVTVPKEQYDEMVEKLADATQSKSNLIAEIKELREKNQITQVEKDDLLKQLENRGGTSTEELTPEKVAELAEQTAKKILSERDNETAKLNKEAALNDFFTKHKEFHPDNDEGGIKLSALQKKLERFNTSGLRTREEFISVFEDARNLVVGNTTPSPDGNQDPNPLPPSGSGRPAPVKEADDSKLSPREMQVIERTFGGDKDRYLKQKAKRPDYVATLLQYSSN